MKVAAARRQFQAAAQHSNMSVTSTPRDSDMDTSWASHGYVTQLSPSLPLITPPLFTLLLFTLPLSTPPLSTPASF